MAGIVFPNVIGTLAPLMQLEQSERRNALTERAYAREDEDRAREREVGQHVPAALAGDKDALGRVAAMSPKTAFALAPLLERADAATRTRAKEAAAWQQQAALGVLSAPPEQRPAAYAAALEDGRARGYDISKLPPQYTPDVEGRLNFYVGQARDANKWFEENANRPTPIGPAPGGAPAAAPAGATGDVIVRAGGAISGIESGGRYDAVGPDTGKGQRAYGKYQVMDFNIGPWTQEVFGKPMTPQEFLANPQAQDAVFNHKFGQYVKQYGGPEQAARVWFGGPGGLTNPGAKDVLGTTVDSYAQKFNAGFGAAPQVAGAPAGLPQGDAVRADASGNALPPDQNAQFRAMQLPQGARFIGIKGVPITKDGAAYVQLPDGSTTWVPMPERKAPKEGGGPFAGTSMDAQAMNMLLTGDPASPQYALAYSHLSKPRTTIDEQGRAITVQPMDLSAVRKPASSAGAPAAAPAGAPVPDGTTTQAIPGGGSVSVSPPVAPKGPTAKELADLRTARIEAKKMTDALEDFRKQFTDATVGDRAKSLAGTTTPLNTSYNVAALLAKGEQLFNLGVLNGPDLEIIRRTLPDPSTFRGAATGTADMSAAVDKVIAVLNGALAERERQLGGTTASPANAPKPPPQGGDRERTLFDARKAIEQGASRDAVIERLRSMGVEPEGL